VIEFARVLHRSLPLYVGAGGIATASHYAVTTAAVEVMHIRPLLASIAGFAVGALVKYWLNYSVAFRSKAPHSVASVRFAVALAVLFVLNAVVFALLNEGLSLHYLFAQVATTIVLIWPGYWLHRQWVFRSAQW
jgi:putative flippase GtrA